MFLSILNAVYVFPNCQFLTPSLFILHSQTCWKQLEPHNEVGGKGGQHNQTQIFCVLKLGYNEVQVTKQQAKTSRPN